MVGRANHCDGGNPMANMSSGDRGSFERTGLGSERSPRSSGAGRGTTVTFVILVLILIALGGAAIAAIDGWAHIIVIADLILIVGCLAVFIRGRKEQQHSAVPEAADEGWRPW